MTVRRAAGEGAHVGDARDVLALDLRRRTRFTRKPRHRVAIAERLWQEELEGDLLVELDVMRGDDDPHPTDPEDALDAVLAGENVAFPDARRSRVGTVLDHSLRPPRFL